MNKPCSDSPPLCQASSDYSAELFSAINGYSDVILSAHQSDCCRVYFITAIPTQLNGVVDEFPADLESLILYVGKNKNHLKRPLTHIKDSAKHIDDDDLYLNPCNTTDSCSHSEMICNLLKLKNEIGVIVIPVCNVTLAFALETAVINRLDSCLNSNNGRAIPELLTENVINDLLSLVMTLVRSRIKNHEFDAVCYIDEELVTNDYTIKV